MIAAQHALHNMIPASSTLPKSRGDWMARRMLFCPGMTAKRKGSKENRAGLTLRRERLRNLTVEDLARAQGGADPLAALRKLLGGGGQQADGGCRYSE